jgi:hypothetical protein
MLKSAAPANRRPTSASGTVAAPKRPMPLGHAKLPEKTPWHPPSPPSSPPGGRVPLRPAPLGHAPAWVALPPVVVATSTPASANSAPVKAAVNGVAGKPKAVGIVPKGKRTERIQGDPAEWERQRKLRAFTDATKLVTELSSQHGYNAGLVLDAMPSLRENIFSLDLPAVVSDRFLAVILDVLTYFSHFTEIHLHNTGNPDVLSQISVEKVKVDTQAKAGKAKKLKGGKHEDKRPTVNHLEIFSLTYLGIHRIRLSLSLSQIICC